MYLHFKGLFGLLGRLSTKIYHIWLWVGIGWRGIFHEVGEGLMLSLEQNNKNYKIIIF